VVRLAGSSDHSRRAGGGGVVCRGGGGLGWVVRHSDGDNDASDVSVSDGLAVVALSRRVEDPAIVGVDILSHRNRRRTRWLRSGRSRLAGNGSWVGRSGVVGGHRVAGRGGVDVSRQPGSVVGRTMLSGHRRRGGLKLGNGDCLSASVGGRLDIGGCGSAVMVVMSASGRVGAGRGCWVAARGR
jgi:hypothetical protein